MALSIVGFLVGKLGDLIIKETQLLGGVKNQVERMQAELMNIQHYLSDADSKRRKGDARVGNWLSQLRDVAYRIEDAIDTFYLELEDNHSQVEDNHLQVEDSNLQVEDSNLQKKFCCYFGKLKRKAPENVLGLHKLKKLGQKAMNVPGLHKLGTELGDIQKELEEIFKTKDRYEIKPLQDEGSESDTVIFIPPVRRAAYQDVDETEVVGLDADKVNIIKLMHPAETAKISGGLRRAVLTIVGTGGLGKTTLARMVYNSVKTNFRYHIMLSISQKYNLTDLLRKMLRKLKDNLPENEDEGYYVEELKRLLSGKRYLIILDDVWGVELWDQLKYALPDDEIGSRVLMTSRSINVAKSADSRMTPYKLAFLNDTESLDLLLKKAIPYQECPRDLLELADKLSKKCKGLPLALVVIGGILSTRDQDFYDWKMVLDTMDWHDEGKDCMKILAMSYEDMPYYLKACFLYLAFFPEDYEISVKRLIKMWAAEEFIKPKKYKTIEEAAEICLEQLFQRSMVQVASRCPNGSIKSFRVHDLLRDLAMHEAGKENFISVFPEPQGNNHRNKVSRRVSVQSDDCREFMKYIDTKTRSLLLFRADVYSSIEYSVDMAEFKLLRVIEIAGLERIELRGLDRLIHLKYLGFINCARVKLPNDFSLGHSKSLETLHLRINRLSHLLSSLSLWTIGTLRHVIYKGLPLAFIKFRPLDRMYGPTMGPPSNADLPNLQTLKWVKVPETWHEYQLPLLKNLRMLGLHSESYNDCKMVDHLLETLPYLLSLGIRSPKIHIPKEIVYPRRLPNYQNLQTLHLHAEWSYDVTLDARLFPPHLVKLKLVDSRLRQDPMPELGNLNNLKKLLLSGNVCSEKEMICPTGFPVLQTLLLELTGNTSSVTIMEGVMPKLKHLTNNKGTELNLPPELRHFSNL
ncbi:Disease resistance family protein [Rhynchospora pubera]|uniref:Disease resistance family protein n=1 Tax=Rhynchospora pubera TaxID=906938 RepID=A0AAV8DCK5_9POAL|nr:Disease resistance family protein [Rhynchospora pubera]